MGIEREVAELRANIYKGVEVQLRTGKARPVSKDNAVVKELAKNAKELIADDSQWMWNPSEVDIDVDNMQPL